MEEEVIQEYHSSLEDLNANSKPLINMLTMLAEDNEQYAPEIVKVIETHLQQAEPSKKLPTLYLIDSIIKNLPKSSYPSLFAQNIVQTFCTTFEKVDEKTRQCMYKVRQTWNEIFRNRKLYAIDVRVNHMDPAWPITAVAETDGKSNIFVNPKFIAKKEEDIVPELPVVPDVDEETLMRQQLIAKKAELLKIQQQKLEMELRELEEATQNRSHPKVLKNEETLISETPSISPSLPNVPKRGPRMPNRDPRTVRDPRVRDPRLQNKPPTVSAASAQPPISQVTTNPMPGIPGPNPIMMPFPGMPPPHLMPMMPNPGMMLSQPPPGLFPPPVISQPPPGMPPTSTITFPTPSSLPPPTQTFISENSNDEDTSDRAKPPGAQPNDNFDKEKSVGSQRHSTDKGTLRSELERRAKENESEVKHKSENDSHKPRSRDSKSKERRSGESARSRDSKERSKDSRSSRKSSPRHERGINRDSKSREEDAKRKSQGDIDAKKAEDRKKDSKPKDRSKGRLEEDSDSRDSNHSRRDKEKSPSLKERSRSPVSRKRPSPKEKKSPKKTDKVKDDIKIETTPEPTESEEKMDTEKKQGFFDSGYKIPKKEVIAEGKDDLDEREQKRSKDQKLVKGNSKRDLSEISESADKADIEEEGPSKKPRLEDQPKLDNELSALFGSEDQDYRSLMDVDQRKPKNAVKKGWAQYRHDHPGEFSYEIERERRDTDHRSPLDMDHRKDTDFRSQKGDLDLRGVGESSKTVDIPNALSLENRETILEQIEKRRKSGELTFERHQELLKDLSRLDVLQKIQQEREKLKGELNERDSDYQPGPPKDWRSIPSVRVPTPPRPTPSNEKPPVERDGPISEKWQESRRSAARELNMDEREFRSPRSDFDSDSRDRFPPFNRDRPGPPEGPHHREIFDGPPDDRRPPMDVDRGINRDMAGPPHRMGRPMKDDERFPPPDWQGPPDRDYDREMWNYDGRGLPGERGPPDFRQDNIDNRPDRGRPFQDYSNRGPRRGMGLRGRGSRGRNSPVFRDQRGPMDEDFPPYDMDNRRQDDRFPPRGGWHGGWDRGNRGGPRGNFRGRGMFPGPRGPPPQRDMDDRDFDNRPPPDFMNKPRPPLRQLPPMKDSRWANLSNFPGTDDTEEFVIDGKPFHIKVGAPPRKVRFGKGQIEIFADPNQRCILVDGQRVYTFGDYVREVKLQADCTGRNFKVFYHGAARQLWIDGFLHELRLDAPPKIISIKDKEHTIRIDGRDGMILLDNKELGVFGGPPRFVFIAGNRCELRFEPPPRQILIDGKLCELKLDRKIPCVMINGVPHGIRFDGPPRDIIVNNIPHTVPMDRAVKIRIGTRPHNIAFGGPAHEVIFDGKWYEVKFDGPPKTIVVGNRQVEIQLKGNSPDVKILEPIEDPQLMMPVNNVGFGPHAPNGMQGPRMRPPGPGNFQTEGPMMNQGSNRPIGPGPIGGPRPPVMDRPSMQRPNQPMENPPMMQPPNSMMPNQPPHGMMGPGLNPMMPNQGFPMMQPTPMSMQSLSTGANTQIGAGPILSTPVADVSLTSNQSSQIPGIIPSAPATSAPFDIGSLFQKLLDTGIISKPEVKAEPSTEPSKVKKEAAIPEIKKDKIDVVPDLLDLKTDSLKKQYKGVFQRMYSGIQCTSCGMRFTSSQTEKYREHLDWHFRQNQREKDGARILLHRKWFYTLDEWIDYEEIDESEDKGKSIVFEQSKPSTVPDTAAVKINIPENDDILRCPAASDGENVCDICGDPFDQYWDEEAEEWHLKDAIRAEGKTYHPVCYEDEKEGSIIETTPTPTPKTAENNPLIMQIKKELGQIPADTVIQYQENMIVKPKVKIEEPAEEESVQETQQTSNVEETVCNRATVKQEVPDAEEEVKDINTEGPSQESVAIEHVQVKVEVTEAEAS
ncbi:pre-mRNA cleavage complex 2 protein Pcf11-like [Saccostrea echinata]|uniref:pre-mRNA cleavage complex 2 protein Pcf11-like n=1 Tax=Saccostrea echinata TaxID=191078 RepID=UPI002A83C213|nr:pre-mRNA cleavage complex 2 protein Pcf11-like [Saccostrea echinata]